MAAASAAGFRPQCRWFPLALVTVFLLAFVVRLAGILRGAGLHAGGNYDDGVHFAAALGLINGLLPYRDFLLLHPPGVAILLAPFAALSWLIGEPDAVAVARLAWMLLGGVNAVLCTLALRPVHRLAGLLAGLCYALSPGAVYVEHTMLLEAPATTMLLAALVVTRLLGAEYTIRTRHYVVAGLLLGFSPVLKIWGVVPLLVMVVAICARRGRRPGLITLGAAVGMCAAACLPFFVSAPVQMWQMVIVAQVGRRRVDESPAERLTDLLGLRGWTPDPTQWSVVLTLAIALLVLCLVLCLLRTELRAIAALLVTHGALAMTTPMWFVHYAGLTSAPIALAVGGGVAVLLSWCGRLEPTPVARGLSVALVALTAVGILALAYPMRTQTLGGREFPAAELAPTAGRLPGCLATDWPLALLQLNLMQRQIDRGCRFVVDLGGYSYYLTDSAYHDQTRRKNKDWQMLALAYYRSADAVLPVRFSAESGYSAATARTMTSWPVLVKAGGCAIRVPQPEEPRER
ncbi:MAG: hypothetical protein QM650_02670 [Microlunatus sp.]